MMIASQLVMGDDLNTSWEDIAGLDNIIEEITDTLIIPIQKGNKTLSKLIRPPKGNHSKNLEMLSEIRI